MEKPLDLSLTTSARKSWGVPGTPWGDATELPTPQHLCGELGTAPLQQGIASIAPRWGVLGM